MKSLRRVTPGAAQVTAGEPDEDARKSGARSFALNGFENFCDEHLSVGFDLPIRQLPPLAVADGR